METPTEWQRLFLELLIDGTKEYRQIESLFDWGDARLVAEIKETYERNPPWVRVSISVGGVSPMSHATWYELTSEGRAAAMP
jgi:hypothetical protein